MEECPWQISREQRSQDAACQSNHRSRECEMGDSLYPAGARQFFCQDTLFPSRPSYKNTLVSLTYVQQLRYAKKHDTWCYLSLQTYKIPLTCLGLGLCFLPRWGALVSKCSTWHYTLCSAQSKTYWKQEIPLIPLDSPRILPLCEITDWNRNHLITGMLWTLDIHILPESDGPEPRRPLGLCSSGCVTPFTWCFELGVGAEYNTPKCVRFPRFAYFSWLEEAEKGQQTHPQPTAHSI